ncbi:MAG: ATP-binding protein, partial [Cytophagales bacterium]
HAYNNIGLTLGYAGDTKAELENYAKAGEIFLKIGETEGYANTILNKATAFTYMKDFVKADKLYRQAMAVYEKLGYANAINMTLQSMAENTMEANNPKQALVYAKQALLSSRKNGYKTEEASCLGLISKIFKSLNKWDSAYSYLNHYQSLNNEIFNAEKVKISTELDKKYKTELKEQEIVELQQLNKIQELEAASSRQWQIGLVVFLVLLLVLTAILYSRFQLKKKNEQELNDKNLELERLNIFKDRMFAVISHDLRNPVNAFQFIIQGLNQNIDHVSKEDLKDFLATTLQAAIDLKSLLNNLLEWALVQIGKLPFKPEIVSVNEIIDDCIQHLQSIANAKNVVIESSIDQEIALGDKNMIVIIVRNFLSNAIKFSSANSKIKFSAQSTTDTVLISIQDFGIGMKEHDVAKLLNPDSDVFSIGNSNEKGAGIGLMLCKELAMRNEGKIFIESKWGEGSIFTLELPKP